MLVMGTLHTNGAAATVDRMVNVFPSDKQSHVRTMLSTSLRGVVSQQLLKRADRTGRVAALEILVNTPAVANLIRQGKLDQLETVMQSGCARAACAPWTRRCRSYSKRARSSGEGGLHQRDQQSQVRARQRHLKAAGRWHNGQRLGLPLFATALLRLRSLLELTSKRTILVTSALPYANGSLHIGHIIELRPDRHLGALPADARTSVHGTSVRATRTARRSCCSAEQEGIAPEELITRVTAEHKRDFAELSDRRRQLTSTTRDPKTRRSPRSSTAARKARAHHRAQDVKQAYDEERQMFLPDRYVKGECPNCGNAGSVRRLLRELRRDLHARRPHRPRLDAVRDEAGRCASPSTTSSSSATSRASCASGCRSDVDASRRCAPSSTSGSKAGLQDWDISRDAPYFGFEIPGAPGQVFLRVVRCADRLPRRASRRCASETRPRLRRVLRRRQPAPSCITSSARTSATSTTCSGPRCCTAPAAASRPRCSCTAFSRSTARRCRSRAARSSPRAAISTPADRS